MLLPARINELQPQRAVDQFDYVSFDVDNPGFEFKEPSYGLVFRSDEGALLGGFFAARANWFDIESVLPEDETDRYPPGSSRHTLPVWLPPDVQPNDVTMYVWR